MYLKYIRGQWLHCLKYLLKLSINPHTKIKIIFITSHKYVPTRDEIERRFGILKRFPTIQ